MVAAPVGLAESGLGLAAAGLGVAAAEMGVAALVKNLWRKATTVLTRGVIRSHGFSEGG